MLFEVEENAVILKRFAVVGRGPGDFGRGDRNNLRPCVASRSEGDQQKTDRCNPSSHLFLSGGRGEESLWITTRRALRRWIWSQLLPRVGRRCCRWRTGP